MVKVPWLPYSLNPPELMLQFNPYCELTSAVRGGEGLDSEYHEDPLLRGSLLGRRRKQQGEDLEGCFQ